MCAERMKALEAREAAAAQLEAMLEQQGAQNQQVEEGMNVLAERESKVSTREAEFEQLCAERMKALEAREAQLARASLGDGLTAELAALEGREKECTEREKALEVREAATAADAKVHGCFYQELDEQKQLLAEREQAALEQEALLEKREQAIEESESKLELQKKELQRLEDGLRKRETLCAEQEKEGRRASAAAAATAKEARLGAQASRQVEQVQQNLATASTKMAARSISNLEAGVTGGGVAGAIAALLQDVELGERSGVSLVDLGLSDIAGLPEADKFMQLLSALMAVRADARLIVFGLWLLCHLIYVLYLIYAHVKKLPPLASSRTPGFPSNNDQENAYDDSPRHATTSNGNLWWVPQDGTLRPHADPALPLGLGKRRLGGRHGTDCSEATDFEPGIVPRCLKLLEQRRATVEASNNNVWPFTYSQCPSENLEKANQDPPKQQRINECLGDNWTQRFGLHPHQGRGALEIDILEVLPGNHAPNYKKEKVDTGICKPQTEILYSKLDIPRPHLLNTLQAAPGIPFLADQRPPSPPRLNTTCVPEWGTQWYDGLRPEVPGVYGSSSTINYHNYGKYIVNINPWTDVEIQVDSIGALTGLDEDAFSQHHALRQKRFETLMSDPSEIKLSRQDKPERKFFENPLTWWKGTSLRWNTDVTIWNGTGEAEALCELFVDNLGSLLGTTGACVGTIGYGIVGNLPPFAGGYGTAIAKEWEKVYFSRNIPGCAFAMLLGNLFYAWQCGRLGSKEGRNDVTAQPYGINTTGVYITLFAIQLEALISAGFMFQPAAEADSDAIRAAAVSAADHAWKISVACNFVLGLFEMLGAFIGESIRKVAPMAAFYAPMMGVGFVYLAFVPMLAISQEPMMCLIPLLIVFNGFFGGVRYHIYKKLTIPIGLMAILAAVIAGWSGACARESGTIGAMKYGYTLPYFDSTKVTCTGTSQSEAQLAWDTYAFQPNVLANSVFVGLGGFADIGSFMTTLFLVGVVGFVGTMSCVESASAAGDDYPMAETMLVDGAGTCIGALFGSFYSTTVYIGHPIHKALGAKRGFSLINGIIYFFLLLSGLFAALYQSIPECAGGSILVFVGLLLGRQAFEETPPRHYPALLLSLFPYICNWAKLSMSNEGVLMMGQAGGLMFSVVLTWLFCLCIDRDFWKATLLSFVAIFLSLFGFFASHNAANDEVPPTEGDEKIGFYGMEERNINAITKDGEPMGTLLARQLLLEPVSMILNIDVSKQWGWDIIEQNCGGDCGCCLDCGEPECVSCMLEKGGGNEYLHKLCRTLPATYEVDYIRVFQTKDQQAEDRQGCSPKVAPTQGWIDTQRSRYVLPNFDAPLQPVYAGGGRCQTDANCGSNSGSGACSDGVCKCTNGWTGPSCLARMAGAALRCRPLELTLVGGGPCFVNSTHDNCGRGTCIEINRPWDAPWQTVEGLHRFSPVGTGDGRCQCHDGWKGPFCSVESGGQSKTEAKKTDQWDEKTCVPDSSLSSPKLEALITKLCRNWLMGKETIERVSQACSDIDWSSDGKYSQCGSWPRASLVVQAAKEEKGICCTRLDEQGREICFEDEAQFDILLGVATASLALMAVLGCLRQAHLRGGLLSRRSERAAANGFDFKRDDSTDDTDTDDEVNGFSGSDSEESK
ncbi:unnamed protein product [Durusdinium trenchii]